MTVLLAFSITLFIAVLLSDLAERSVLSTTVVFLLGGLLAGDGVFHVVHLVPRDAPVREIATLALFSTLFTDGMRVDLGELREHWSLPGRALLLGFPITLLLIAGFANALLYLAWIPALLVASVLSPTDPVFAAAIVEREALPLKLRRLLGIESGMNDGLALPFVTALIAISLGVPHWSAIVIPVLAGVILGIAVPIGAHTIARIPMLRAAPQYRAYAGVTLGLLVLTITRLTGANEFLGAYTAGITVTALRSDLAEEFRELGSNIAGLLKFAGLFVFGALLRPVALAHVSTLVYVFAIVTIVIARPVGIALSLIGSRLERPSGIAAAWFGPKGFASVLYAVMVLQSGVPDAQRIFDAAAVTILISLIAHSSTDVLVARWLIAREPGREAA